MQIRKSLYILSIAGGFLLGVLLTGTVMSLTGGQQTASVGEDSKMQLLEKCIDNYYLRDYDEEKLMEGAYKGYVAGLEDPYSAYMTAGEYQDFKLSTSGEYSGVGITFSQDNDGNFMVMEINPGSPADRAGIKPGDQLLTVDGKEYDDVELMATDIRGDKGTEVTIEYIHGGKSMKKTLVREEIELQSVEYRMLDDKTAYIKISSFINNTAKDFDEALKAVREKNASQLVLDLRDDGGGLVDQSVSVADQFLDEGVVCYTEDKDGNVNSYDAQDGRTKIKTVVLINGNSASAAEILAAAMQDNGYKIVGEKSFGKGVIQSTVELEDGSALKLTIMQYLSPDKHVINEKGVKPDYKVSDDKKTKADEQMDKAVELLNAN